MMSIIAQAVPALDTLNPIGILEDASKNVPGFEGGLSSALNIVLLLTVLTVAPAILILCTCFTRPSGPSARRAHTARGLRPTCA